MHTPCPKRHLRSFIGKLQNKESFYFVRFSDGEIEILRNRYLEIDSGKTFFRGRESTNIFPVFDNKKFDPSLNQDIRKDLLDSALFRGENFYKGIPTRHNNALVDREFLLRLNGGMDLKITFADLFLNSNYRHYRENLVPLFEKYEKVYVVANYRANLVGSLSGAVHIKIPDNFFLEYRNTLNSVMEKLGEVGSKSLVLSSASSLSNIIAHKLYGRDITFIDIGTSINDLLSLKGNIREYHGSGSLIKDYFYERSKRHNIKW